jgi:predicted hotdog family 3-hydroxylacyl-ACP dehydratase
MNHKETQKAAHLLTLPAPAITLLPHRGAMLLVEELVWFDAETGRGRVRARGLEDSIFADRNGHLEKVVLIEMLAQAYACVRGFEDLKAGREIGPGFLVGVRRWQSKEQVNAGDELVVEISTTAVIGDFYLAEGRVLRDEKTVAEGELKLWTP